MAAQTCEDVLRGMGYADDGKGSGKKVTRDSTSTSNTLTKVSKKGEDEDFLDAVIRGAGKVDDAANSLMMYDCSRHLLDWIFSMCPILKAASANIESATSELNATTINVTIGDLLQGTTPVQQFCNLVVTVFGTVNAWLEVILKAAFALFDKIDTARQRMQDALKAITDAVLECILDVYDMIEKFLGGLLKVTMSWDWSALEQLLMDCPCLCRFISYVTGCDEDKDGNSISDQPDLVLRCIRENLWYMDGLNLATALSDIMDTYIKQYLIWVFDAIKLAIDSVFTLFITPFRYLIKAYADLLRKKLDVSFMLEPLKTAHLDCLLIYTRETIDGETVFQMSVTDMLSSMKMWVNCLEHLCPALSERIKNKVKKYNEDFRISGEYWNRAFEADIYLCCMRADDAMESGFSMEQLRDMWSDLFDRLRAMNDRAKNKVLTAKVTYGLDPSSTGGIQYYTGKNRALGQAAKGKEEDDNLTNATLFSTAGDLENNLIPGNEPLTELEDSVLRQMGISLIEGTRENSYFGEKWAQFVRFISFYAFSGETLDKLTDAIENGSHPANTSSDGSQTQFHGSNTRTPESKAYPSVEDIMAGEKNFDDDDNEDSPNYWVDPDYDAERIQKIDELKWGDMRPGERLSVYYARMYATTAV